MVNSITNFSRNGLSDWFLQRVSAIVMLCYTIFILCFVLAHPHMSYADWSGLFAHLFVKIITLLTLLCLLAHAWIGLWIVFTDYVKCYCLRVTLQVLLVLLLLGYLFWVVTILWS